MRILWFSLLLSAVDSNVTGHDWMSNLLKYIGDDYPPYQVMLVIDKVAKNLNARVNNFSQRIIQIVPAYVISFEQALSPDRLSSFATPEAAMLLITIHASKDYDGVSPLINSIDLIGQLSTSRVRSKCLMISLVPQKQPSYEELLRYMGFKKFMDVTILELSEDDDYGNKSLLRFNREVPTLHQFNPSTGNYLVEEYSLTSQWFLSDTNSTSE